jgi:hypothetical protein
VEGESAGGGVDDFFNQLGSGGTGGDDDQLLDLIARR